jgi:hypothetical protein
MSIIKWIVKASELIMVVKFQKKNRRNYLTVFLFKRKFMLANQTNDGNKPNAILSTIAITATA